MSVDTGIEWTDSTWNPLRGCSRVSEGCRHCYAEAVAARFSGPGQPYEGLATRTPSGPRWTGTVRLVEDHLTDPLRWKKPRRIFVNSMSDLFHESVPDEWIDRIFAVMALSPQHTFQVLTKRPERMLAYFTKRRERVLEHQPATETTQWHIWAACGEFALDPTSVLWHWGDRQVVAAGQEIVGPWPIPNVWLGVSCEDQKTADERIPLLLQTPAAVRFVSAEPLLGPIDLTHIREGSYDRDALSVNDLQPPWTANAKLDWVIVGGESGPHARPCDLAWIRSLVQQCKAADVACFVKQLGAFPRFDRDETALYVRDRKGGDMTEWPEDLRVREFQRVREAISA